MTNSRIIELAIKGLEAERAKIDEELAAVCCISAAFSVFINPNLPIHSAISS
jgi:hypothetical protein